MTEPAFENPSEADMLDATAALLWSRLPAEVRTGVLAELSIDQRDTVARGIRSGRKVIHRGQRATTS